MIYNFLGFTHTTSQPDFGHPRKTPDQLLQNRFSLVELIFLQQFLAFLSLDRNKISFLAIKFSFLKHLMRLSVRATASAYSAPYRVNFSPCRLTLPYVDKGPLSRQDGRFIKALPNCARNADRFATM